MLGVAAMRYEGKLYRPPSEGDSLILQATLGCSWNRCVYCDMYRDKAFRVRSLDAVLADIGACAGFAARVEKVFVADGDALVMPLSHWEPILEACRTTFPALRQVSCYAMARNLLEKTPAELLRLRALGLSLLYIGPESGDPVTLKRLAKGQGFEAHVDGAQRAHAAGMALSAIFLIGAGGTSRSLEHARGSARLATEMDPEFLSALTLTVVPATPLARLAETGRFALPEVRGLLEELREFVSLAAPSDALFRTNHASNYLPLGGRLPRDRERIVHTIDRALAGEIPLRPELARGL